MKKLLISIRDRDAGATLNFDSLDDAKVSIIEHLLPHVKANLGDLTFAMSDNSKKISLENVEEIASHIQTLTTGSIEQVKDIASRYGLEFIYKELYIANVAIEESELNRLLSNSIKYEILMGDGVDNWEHYMSGKEAYLKEYFGADYDEDSSVGDIVDEIMSKMLSK